MCIVAGIIFQRRAIDSKGCSRVIMARSRGSVCDEIYLGGFHLGGKILSVSVEGV